MMWGYAWLFVGVVLGFAGWARVRLWNVGDWRGWLAFLVGMAVIASASHKILDSLLDAP